MQLLIIVTDFNMSKSEEYILADLTERDFNHKRKRKRET